MKIYLCHSSGFDYQCELYDPIRTACLKHEIVLPHEAAKNVNSKKMIESSDLIIAEVSYPSTGMGIELGWADAAGIPIRCIYRHGSVHPSALLHVSKVFIAYNGPNDVSDAVERAAA